MSEENQEYIDIFRYLIPGYLLVWLSMVILRLWQDNREDWYANNPDILQGTFLVFGIFIFFPVLMLGLYYAIVGFSELFDYIRWRTQPEDDLSLHK